MSLAGKPLGHLISGVDPDSFPPKSNVYWPPNDFEAKLRKDLPFQGEDEIIAHLVGKIPDFDTIFATHKSYNYNGPINPEIIEGEKESVLCRWLERKGNVSSLYPLTLRSNSHPQESARTSISGWSSLKRETSRSILPSQWPLKCGQHFLFNVTAKILLVHDSVGFQGSVAGRKWVVKLKNNFSSCMYERIDLIVHPSSYVPRFLRGASNGPASVCLSASKLQQLDSGKVQTLT